MSSDPARAKMVAAWQAIEALRPFVGTGRDEELIKDAWDALWREAIAATRAYLEALRG